MLSFFKQSPADDINRKIEEIKSLKKQGDLGAALNIATSLHEQYPDSQAVKAHYGEVKYEAMMQQGTSPTTPIINFGK